jgi:hypothetical protein
MVNKYSRLAKIALYLLLGIVWAYTMVGCTDATTSSKDVVAVVTSTARIPTLTPLLPTEVPTLPPTVARPPTPDVPQSPAQKLKQVTFVGGTITNVIYNSGNKILIVDFDIWDDFSEDGVRDSARFGTLGVAKAAMESGIAFDELKIGGYFDMVDTKGRTSHAQVLKMFFSRQSLSEVEDFGPHMRKYVYTWADKLAYLHPAFRDK